MQKKLTPKMTFRSFLITLGVACILLIGMFFLVVQGNRLKKERDTEIYQEEFPKAYTIQRVFNFFHYVIEIANPENQPPYDDISRAKSLSTQGSISAVRVYMSGEECHLSLPDEVNSRLRSISSAKPLADIRYIERDSYNRLYYLMYTDDDTFPAKLKSTIHSLPCVDRIIAYPINHYSFPY